MFACVVFYFNLVMTKRAYPFEINFTRQSKIHINDVEVDEVIARDSKARTLRRLYSTCHNVITTEIRNKLNIVESTKDKNMKQTYVTSYFHNNNQLNTKMNIKPAVIVCGTPVFQQCSYCDVLSITHTCIKCAQVFCQSCSFSVYSDSSESRTCLSCS